MDTLTDLPLPSGLILAFAGPKEKIPQGWVACDGTLYNRTDSKYATLFAAVGVSWGGDGADKFAVPDLRGQFLRGVTENTSVDPETAQRTNSRVDLPSPGNGGNNVGSKQACQVQSHAHEAEAHVNRNLMSGSNGSRDCDGGDEKYNSDPNLGSISVTVTIRPNQGAETRPVNAYVYYIIKL